MDRLAMMIDRASQLYNLCRRHDSLPFALDPGFWAATKQPVHEFQYVCIFCDFNRPTKGWR